MTGDDDATMEKSARDEARLSETQHIVALVPALLSAPRSPDVVRAILADPLMTTTQEISAEWQQMGSLASFYEMGATTHGVQRDRMSEVVGLRGSIGETVAVSRAALIECWLWARK